MIRIFYLLLLISLPLFSISAAVFKPRPAQPAERVEASAKLSQASWEETLGRELTWKEKVTLKFFHRQVIKAERQQAKRLNRWIEEVNCSRIILKNGDVIEADISQINPTEIKYKRCGKPNDPEFIIAKGEVLSIQAEDGEIIYRDTGTSMSTSSFTRKQNTTPTDGLAIASLASGVGGLLITLFLSALVGAIAGIAGIVFGFLSLRKRRTDRNYRGFGISWASIIAGIASVGLLILIFALI